MKTFFAIFFINPVGARDYIIASTSGSDDVFISKTTEIEREPPNTFYNVQKCLHFETDLDDRMNIGPIMVGVHINLMKKKNIDGGKLDDPGEGIS